MFNKKKTIAPEQISKSEIEAIQLRLKRLENPPKYKIGDKVNFDTKTKCCRLVGEGIIAEVKLIESFKRYYDRGYCDEEKNYYMDYSDNSYQVWTGKELIKIEEHYIL